MEKIKFVESATLTHRWTSVDSRRAEEYLNREFPGRSYVRMGKFSIVISRNRDRLIAAEIYPAGEILRDGFDADRLVQCGEVIQTLWRLDNRGERHPLHDAILAEIKFEVEGWGKTPA